MSHKIPRQMVDLGGEKRQFCVFVCVAGPFLLEEHQRTMLDK
jgi:hypothetical protein